MQIYMEPRRNYLFVKASGQFQGLKEMKEGTVDALNVAVEKRLHKIIFDGRDVKGTVTMSVMDRFIYGVFLAEKTLDMIINENAPLLRLAVVLEKPLCGSDKFVEIVARNRGIPLKFTDSLVDAFEWLGEKEYFDSQVG
jgi:hypothetical protein